jgi:hypothetical protein
VREGYEFFDVLDSVPGGGARTEFTAADVDGVRPAFDGGDTALRVFRGRKQFYFTHGISQY